MCIPTRGALGPKMMHALRLAVVLLILARCAAGQEPDPMDAVCKSNPIPADKVIVAEFQSELCSPPLTKNAWDTVAPIDGTVTCSESKSISASANVAQLMFCEKVHSDKCPRRPDGTPNATVLRAPVSCYAIAQTTWNVNISRHCVSPSFSLGENEVVVGFTNLESCEKEHGNFFGGKQSQNTAFVRTVNRQQTAVFSCAGPPLNGPYGKLLWANEIIVRRLHSDYCDLFIHGAQLNALVTLVIHARPAKNQTICYGTPMINTEFKPQFTHDWVVYPKVMQQDVYDEMCGGQTGINNGVRIIDPPNPNFKTHRPTPWD